MYVGEAEERKLCAHQQKNKNEGTQNAKRSAIACWLLLLDREIYRGITIIIPRNGELLTRSCRHLTMKLYKMYLS
jgi:hypothetical protein